MKKPKQKTAMARIPGTVKPKPKDPKKKDMVKKKPSKVRKA